MARVPRILLVEDDSNISFILKLALQNLKVPYHLDTAFSSEEALEFWDAEPYDLVLSDYNLRGVTGLDLIRAVKQQRQTVTTMLFTAYDTPQLRREAQAAGVDRFVAKPFFMDDFVESVLELLPALAKQLGS